MANRSERDYTSGSIVASVWAIAVPAAASSLLFSLPNLAEGYWLGKVGSDALGTASMGMALRIVFISLIMGLSNGGTALVSRHIGAKEQAEADRATQQTELLILIASVVLAATGYALAPRLLHLMGAEGEILTKAVAYARIIFLGLWALELIPSMGSLLRGAGSADWAFRTNLVSTSAILLLQPLLVLGCGPLPALGIQGSAWAFVLGSVVGVAFQQAVFFSGRARVRIRLEGIDFDRLMIRRIVRVALPTSVERFMPNLAQTIMLGLVAAWGTTALAAYTVTTRVFNLTMMVSMGLGTAAPALVGQNLGARKPERAERSAWMVAGAAVAMVTLAFIPLVSLAPQAVRLFQSEPEVVAAAVGCLQIMALGQLFLTLSSVIGMALRGAGDTLSPMWISTGSLWLVQIPLAYGLPRIAELGTSGLWIALTLTPMVTAVALCMRFWQGHWKLKTV